MFNSIFKIIYFIELVLITAVRSMGTAKYKNSKTELDLSSTLDTILLALNGVGMLVPIFYVFSTWLDFADFSLPAWLSWIGVGLVCPGGCASASDPPGPGPQLDSHPGSAGGSQAGDRWDLQVHPPSHVCRPYPVGYRPAPDPDQLDRWFFFHHPSDPAVLVPGRGRREDDAGGFW